MNISSCVLENGGGWPPSRDRATWIIVSLVLRSCVDSRTGGDVDVDGDIFYSLSQRGGCTRRGKGTEEELGLRL